jgi:hypothetical protein
MGGVWRFVGRVSLRIVFAIFIAKKRKREKCDSLECFVGPLVDSSNHCPFFSSFALSRLLLFDVASFSRLNLVIG